MTMVPSSSSSARLEDGLPTVLTRSIRMPKIPSGITHASLFTLACASALSRLINSQDVVFGRVVSGRAAVPPSVADAIGPCLNRLPVRVRFTPGKSRDDQLVAVQRQLVESLAHEATGLSDIVRHCTTWSSSSSSLQRHHGHRSWKYGCWIQYQNVDENPAVHLPGAVGGLKHRATLGMVPVDTDLMEILAIPDDNDGVLTVKLIAGPCHARDVMLQFLEDVCSELLL